jgi:hypothetical protein
MVANANATMKANFDLLIIILLLLTSSSRKHLRPDDLQGALPLN